MSFAQILFNEISIKGNTFILSCILRDKILNTVNHMKDVSEFNKIYLKIKTVDWILSFIDIYSNNL